MALPAAPLDDAPTVPRTGAARVAVSELRLVDFRNYPALTLANDGRHVVLDRKSTRLNSSH